MLVPPMENTIEESDKVQELKLEVPSKKHKKKELHAKVLKQMEFYFEDATLSKDRYLAKLVGQDPWVDLNLFISFKKIKILTTDVRRIAKALKKSTMLEISEDRTKVRRIIPIQVKEDSEECTIYIQRLPPEADQDWISKQFCQYGPVDYISIPKYKKKEIKGFAFVKYKRAKDARKCVKAFKAKGCELSSDTYPYSLLSITTNEGCDEEIAKEPILKKQAISERVETENCEESDSKKVSKSQVPQKKKKKKKRVSIDETVTVNEGVEDTKNSKEKRYDSGTESGRPESVANPSKVEKEHRGGRKRRGRNSESLNVSDGNDELIINDSSAFESDKKRKKIKHDPSEIKPKKQSSQKIETLPETEMCNIKKKRSISDSTVVAANDEGQTYKNVNMEETKEKKSDSESKKQAQQSSDEVNVPKEKKRKRKRNRSTREKDLDPQDTRLEIMATRESKPSKNEYLEMERTIVEQHSERAAVKIEMEAPCSDPKNLKSDCLVIGGGGNEVMNPDADHDLPTNVGGDSQDESRQNLPDELLNPCKANQYRRNLPHTLIRFMYQLDLSMLCLLRKLIYEHKYPSLSLAFEDSEVDKFNNIVLRYKEKSIHVHIENVDNYYIDNAIGYAGLFTKEKEKQRFFINSYFNSFAKCLISNILDRKLDISSNNIEYLVFYTNSSLDLTEEMQLKRGRSRHFYPFEFESVNMEECEILKDCFFKNDDVQGRGFCQFTRDETMREELLKRLKFSSAMQKAIKERNLPQEFEKQIKLAFLDKLVFAVNQPSREELSSIVKSEIEKNSDVQDEDYITLQERILSNLVASGKPTKLRNYVSRITYEFNLLTLFLHDMFSHKNMFSVNFEEKDDHIFNDITVNYKDRVTYVKAYNADNDIGYSQLFPSREKEGENTFSVNKHFSLFVEGLKNDVGYFIIYTNADLNLTEEKKLKNNKSINFYPLKFDSIDIQKKRYKVLRDCLCINEKGLYQVSQEETTREKVLGLLKLPIFLQTETEEKGKISDENEKEIKKIFLDRLIFAVNQHDQKELNSLIRNEVGKKPNIVPYNHKELREIALRWLESHEFGHITKEIMGNLLKEIRNNRSSYHKTEIRDINDEINFAKSVVGRIGTPIFNQFLDFLVKGEGKNYLEVLRKEKIDLSKVSSILNRAGNNAEKAFERLYDLWFDKNGNKMQYLKTLEKEGMNVSTMSGILNGAGNTAADAFKGLYDLWFDEEGKKTLYLRSIDEHGINLSSISSMLNGAGSKSAESFRDLFNLWFEEEGTKSKYLKNIEKEEINLANITSILNGAGNNATKAFRDLYNLWFDTNGSKTQYLKTLEKEGISLANVCSFLGGTRVNAAEAFQDLYGLWFDSKENKSHYLKTLEKNGINLPALSSILSGAGANVAKSFKDLYNLWFDEKENQTYYLKTLEKEGINLTTMSSILHGAGVKAAKAFKDLYNVWFDKQGNTKQHLNDFIRKTDGEKSFRIHSLSGMLSGAGANAKYAFEKLHGVCFNGEGKRKKVLDDFYEADFNASHLSSMLCAAGVSASSALKRLHSVCFNNEGKRTKFLDDFYKIGFRPGDLCNILSGAIGSLETFHSFCFLDETKKYLDHFLDDKKGFSPRYLSEILHGARANICSALQEFHDVCFDETGNKTRFLADFHKLGFKQCNLSRILCMAGNNAASILVNFHKSCFNKENYLNHFLAEKEIFSSKNLAMTLQRAGLNICSTFEKLHDLCFDEEGNKTNYLKSLIQNNPSNQILNILYNKVRKVPSM